jgi:HEAT repeat protein
VRRPLAVLLVPLLTLAGAAWAGPGEGEAVVARLEWEPGAVGALTVMTLPLKPEPPGDVAPLPGLASPMYARIRWGAGKGLVVGLDVADGGDRIWVDTDLDGDLTDETRDAWTSRGGDWHRSETVLVAYEGEGAPEPVPVTFFRAASWEKAKVRFQPDVHRRGSVVLAGRLRSVALVDRNADLRFDDPATDRLYVDVDGDGQLASAEGSHEIVAPGAPFRIADSGFVAVVASPSGREVRFTPAAPPPALPRAWTPVMQAPAAGVALTPPAETFDALKARIQAEMDLAYAQRQAAVALLGQLGTPEALERLTRLALTDEDPNVKAAAIRAMGNAAFGERGQVTLRQFLGDPNAILGAAAVQALHTAGDPGREARYRDALDGLPAVASQAALHLAYLDSPSARAAVLEAARDHAVPLVRYQAYRGLQSWANGPPADVLLAAAKDAYGPLRALALADLDRLGRPEARALALEAARVRPVDVSLARAAIDVLTAVGDAPSVTAVLDLAGAAPPTLDARLVERLAPLRSPAATKALVEALRSDEPRVRTLAASVLAGIREEAVTTALLAQARREKDEAVAAQLFEALGDHADERAVALLLEHARRRKDSVRRAAVRGLARVGLHTEKVRAFFVSLLDAGSWEERVIALDTVAEAGAVGLGPRVAENLGHEIRQVRLAAAEALGRLREAATVPAMIERLAEEEEPRVRAALAAALYAITAMNLYDDAEIWARWWAEHGPGFVPPTTVPPLPDEQAGGTRAGFYGIPVASSRVVFVIDQSGSMSAEDPRPASSESTGGNRLEIAVKEVLAAVRGMSQRDRVNVILFHTTVHPWRDRLTRLTPEVRSDLTAHLLGQTPMGGTNLYDALALALTDDDVDTVFFLSDGAPSGGTYTADADILREIRRQNQTRRIAIHAVSVGRDSPLMQSLAAQNGGTYVRR